MVEKVLIDQVGQPQVVDLAALCMDWIGSIFESAPISGFGGSGTRGLGLGHGLGNNIYFPGFL